MAKRLQQWSDKWIGNIKLQIGIALEVIQRLDVAAESRVLSSSEIALRRLLKKKLLGLSSLERSIARQRSRLLWLRDGDASTQFFHLHASHRRRRNMITTLKCGDRILSGHDEIAEAADTYYTEVLGNAPAREYGLNLAELGLPVRDLTHLDMLFSAEEVLKVIKTMPLDKAPGPDVFTGRFYYVCWDIIQADFMRALHAFHRGDMRGLHKINNALITLIPKVDGVVDIRDFWPLSLVHGAIKIFAKLLSVRLADELPELVGIHQSAFVHGRSIHDNFMMVQGMARRLHALKVPTVMLKLDISKAFDSVQWPFLVEVISAMGFTTKWIGWMCGLLATSSTRVLINGLPGAPIFSRTGLRQGDPISPMIFILTMEVLHRMFLRAANIGVLEPLAPQGMHQRLLIYADDVMIFLKPKEGELQCCAEILDSFGMASGL